MRNRYVDLLRALAIVRVVVYHSTGWAFLTVAFPAMSLMFALGGSLMASSLDRSGASALGRRLRRLLPSLWVLSALFVPAMVLTGLAVNWRLLLWGVPLADPPANTWGALALSTVWYLRDYLWFVLASPVALWLFRRAPVPMLLAPYALLLAHEIGRLPTNPVIRDFGLYFGAWLLGFAHHDGMLRRVSRRLLVAAALVLAAAGAVWILTHPGPRGYDLNDIALGNALWSGGFMVVLLGFAPAGIGWLDRWTTADRVVVVLNSRALTIYLWHMPIVVGVGYAAIKLGFDTSTAVGLTTKVAVVVALVAVAIALFGRVEDLAARHRRASSVDLAVPVPTNGALGAGEAPQRQERAYGRGHGRMGACPDIADSSTATTQSSCGCRSWASPTGSSPC
jgi:peptidoglycan/LPS O-acetylase OafA/YrhL